MKKFINDPNQVVEEMLQGMVAAHGDLLKQVPEVTAIARADAPVQGKVALVSGGGSGHEPSHAGFVGKGMLDAAVAGEVFTSPTPDQVFEAIKTVGSEKGVLLVIKNYTGDVMNFEMAAELAEMEGIQVDKVVVNDDVAVQDSTYTTGRRGIAGTVLVHKIAGAKAESGAELAEVKAAAEKTIANVRSMGIALTPCTIPAAGKAGFQIADDEMEVGMGIHGEPGISRDKIKSADEVAEILVNKILEDGVHQNGDEVAVMINGMGGTPLMELYIVNRKVNSLLKEKGITVHKTYVGDYMTAIEMAGLSVTLLKLDEELKELLEAPTNAVGF